MGQPTKSDLQAEVEELRTSLDQAHRILTRALGYDEPEVTTQRLTKLMRTRTSRKQRESSAPRSRKV